MTRVITHILAVACVVLTCGGGSATAQGTTPPVAVRVAAASDLKFAFDAIVQRLKTKYPGMRVDAVYGSSGSFHAQLQQKAPFDLFLSADQDYPRDLIRSGIGSDKDLFTYAIGHLVVWVPKASPLPLERDGIRVIQTAMRVAIANPEHAPYGRAAQAALRSAGLWDQVQPRLVLGDSVAQTAQFVQSGAADVGLIGKALAVSEAMKSSGRFVEVPVRDYPPLLQAGLILPWTQSRAAAVRVRDFLLSAEGRSVLTSYGFALPGTTPAGQNRPAR